MSARQECLYVGLTIWMLALYCAIVLTTRIGLWVFPVVCVLLASPVLLYFLATKLELRNWQDILNPKHGSWAFLFGDTFVITLGIGISAYSWRRLPRDGWHCSWQWSVFCLAAGLAAGYAFHLLDRGNYVGAGIPFAVFSPTKIAHDGVAYPVLFGGLLFSGWPVVVKQWDMGRWVVVCVAVWILLCICDMLRGLDPTKLHIEWDTVRFRPL